MQATGTGKPAPFKEPPPLGAGPPGAVVPMPPMVAPPVSAPLPQREEFAGYTKMKDYKPPPPKQQQRSAARARRPVSDHRERRGGRRKILRMRAGRGLSRLTGAVAPRPGLWPDDEERAPEGD